jgi:hypothetical protein
MIGLAIGLIAAATGPNATYGETLLDAMHRRHPEMSAAHIEASDNKGSAALSRRWDGPSRSSQTEKLFDANGNEIGALLLSSRCSRLGNADRVERELARRIYSAASLAEPDPFVAGAIRAPWGQDLIDEAIERDPRIITLALHVTPPGSSLNTIVASSFGRIGKPADSDDQSVIHEGKARREVTNQGKRVAVELPLLDARGHIIGALSTSFSAVPGSGEDEPEKRAVSLRDSFARRTTSLKALFRSVTASRQVRALPSCHS